MTKIFKLNLDDELNEAKILNDERRKFKNCYAYMDTNLDMKNIFHKDYLHSVSSYKDYEKIIKPKNKDLCFSIYYANENMSKNNKSLKEWIEIECKNKDEIFRNSFLKSKFIPNIDLSLENFDEFYEKRKELFINKLKEILI